MDQDDPRTTDDLGNPRVEKPQIEVFFSRLAISGGGLARKETDGRCQVHRERFNVRVAVAETDRQDRFVGSGLQLE